MLPLNGLRVQIILPVHVSWRKIDFMLLKSHDFISRAIVLALISINRDNVMSKLNTSSMVTDKSPHSKCQVLLSNIFFPD